MMNLTVHGGAAVLTCSRCEGSWDVVTSEPFIEQLRELLVGHRCGVTVVSLDEWKSHASVGADRGQSREG